MPVPHSYYRYLTSAYSSGIVQFVKFSIVGVLNTSIHYCSFYLLFHYLGVYYLLASAIGYTLGLINSFLLNKSWTFRVKQIQNSTAFMKFLAVNMVAFLTNLIALSLLTESYSIYPELAQVWAIALSLFVNFLGNKFWVFSEGKV